MWKEYDQLNILNNITNTLGHQQYDSYAFHKIYTDQRIYITNHIYMTNHMSAFWVDVMEWVKKCDLKNSIDRKFDAMNHFIYKTHTLSRPMKHTVYTIESVLRCFIVFVQHPKRKKILFEKCICLRTTIQFTHTIALVQDERKFYISLQQFIYILHVLM